MSAELGFVKSLLQTALASGHIFSDSDELLSVFSTSRFEAPTVVKIEHQDAWYDPAVTYEPEIALCTEVVDGTTLRLPLNERGRDGTPVRTHDNSAGDLVCTDVFSESDWERLAAVIAGLPRSNSGTYTGNGSGSRFIDVGFTPKKVEIVSRDQTNRHFSNLTGGTIGHYTRDDNTILSSTSDNSRPRLTTDGFIVGGGINFDGYTYDWAAWS